ncbi:GyrI-like domain-containing protein [Limosilactobacillus sp. c11Ua_112_M]|uniref:GyrI-like domain-containing protein n=1 Tax=Limosilactobacillus TaxID=2742598 RepID=UPI001782C1B4|nr:MULTISPECIES: GyrI-like domain-containing protein [Limosilactobacillus]MBD8086600.1 GyrI-like domain-containing protein [Limosilactobacillus portuensis]MEC4741187.1 GyrI-like domain-containing protein [Limosilactobacillus sp. c10Ua_36]
MTYDFKKEQPELYRPGKRPAVIKVPSMNYLAVQGKGDPNAEDGEYSQALQLLYGIAYTIKMSKKGDYRIPGYFDFVVPPLEGMWWQPGIKGVDYQHKEQFNFISLIRMPDFVTPAIFDWAVKTATEKKQADFSKVELRSVDEGLCVQALHVGAYDDEPATVEKLHEFITNNDLQLDINDHRHHHEIYLSDPRRTKPANLKTVLRLPVRKQ